MKQELIIGNRIITTPPMEILTELKRTLTNGKLETFIDRGSQIQVQCPNPEHKGGHERHSSCYINVTSDDAPYLWVHCFTCGFNTDFITFVATCMDQPISVAKSWLGDNFGELISQTNINLTDICLGEPTQEEVIDESILNTFEDYHPYMTQRHLTSEVIEKFQIKYDPQYKAIVFPVRDLTGKLVGLTRRAVDGKKFYISKGFNKKNIYLLNEVKNKPEVYVVESQINALTLQGWGYPAVALIGAGTPDEQISELNHSNIRHFILALDNDEAGWKGTKKLCKGLYKNKFVDVVQFPDKRDVNDFTKEEFDSLPRIEKQEYLNLK